MGGGSFGDIYLGVGANGEKVSGCVWPLSLVDIICSERASIRRNRQTAN